MISPKNFLERATNNMNYLKSKLFEVGVGRGGTGESREKF